MTSRPRRSTASTTYAHLLTPLDLSSSSSSDDDDDHSDSAPITQDNRTNKAKGKRRKPVYVPEDSSGSEFELPDQAAPASAGAPSSDDDDDDQGSALDSDDDLDGGASVSGASNLSGSGIGGAGGRATRGGRGRPRGRRTGVGAGRSAGRASASTSTANVVVAAAGAGAPRTASAPTGGVGVAAPRPRAGPPAQHPPTGLGVQHPWIGPLAALAPSVPLRPRAAAAQSVGASEGARAGEPSALADGEVHELLEAHSGNPFGVDLAHVRDMEHVPGRFEAAGAGAGEGEAGSQGLVRERERWGGWYDEVKVREEDIEAVPDDDLVRFVPRQTYPTDRPSRVFTPSVPLPGSDEAKAAAGAAAAAASPALDPSLELPVPPPQFGTGPARDTTAGASQSTAQTQGHEQERGQGQSSASPPDGRIRITCGAIVQAGVDEQVLELERFDTRRLDEIVSKKPGHVFNAGAPIGSLAFAPRADEPVDKEYLLVTTTSHPDALLRHPLSAAPPASSSSSPFSSPPTALLQLWSVPVPPGGGGGFTRETAEADTARMRLELGLCLEGVGECWVAEWCPRGGRGARKSESKGRGKGKGKGRADGDGDAMELDGAEEDDNDARRTTGGDKVGLVAAVFADGSAAILVVPDPTTVRAALGVDDDETAYVKAEPLVRLRVPETGICSVAWGGHEVLAAGCLNGYIAVWRVGDVLRSGQPPDRPPRPTHYFAAHAALVRQLVFVSTPPPHLAARAAHDLDAAPTGIVSVGYDGSAVLSDLREPGGGASVLTHERSALYTVAYSAHTGMAYTLDADDRVKALGLKPSMQGNEGRVTIHRGAIWSIAASPHHATVLSASLDGSAMLSSGVRALRKRRLRGHYLTRMYRLEVERRTGSVRMWDNLEVEYRTALDPYNPYSVKGGTAPLERSTAAWPAEQAVTAAAWHPAIACAPLCATGTAIGLGRVDWAEGGQTPAAAA